MLRWLLSLMVGGLVASGAQAACLSYVGPATLSGVVRVETFAGPPNYESVAAGDAAEKTWLLRLDRPACVLTGNIEAGEAAQTGLDEIQLVLRERTKNIDGRRLVVTGRLFPAMTGHHHTAVLLDVRTLDLR